MSDLKSEALLIKPQDHLHLSGPVLHGALVVRGTLQGGGYSPSSPRRGYTYRRVHAQRGGVHSWLNYTIHLLNGTLGTVTCLHLCWKTKFDVTEFEDKAP